MRRVVGVLVLVLVAVSGCDKESGMELQERAEARAAEARGYIDELARQVGSDPEVRQDVLTDCVPGQEDSGLDLIYTLHVTVEVGTADRLRGEIADHFEADGWTVKRDPVGDDGAVSVRFQKGTFTMGANVSEDVRWAAVSGSGGCVR